MNRDILCVYYSRTGKTRQAVTEIADALDCEIAEVTDGVSRRGPFGVLRCGLDAMRKRTYAVEKIHPRRPLMEYRLVILATPVWAGRCSSVMRGFLKRRGYEIQNAALLLTHRSEEQYREVFDQMDGYLLRPHVASASLCPGSTSYHFWRDRFIKNCLDFTAGR